MSFPIFIFSVVVVVAVVVVVVVVVAVVVVVFVVVVVVVVSSLPESRLSCNEPTDAQFFSFFAKKC